MKGEGYKTTASHDRTIYHFSSVGPKGTIYKVVSYSFIGDDTWNLAFGDLDKMENKDDFDDEVLSGNQDLLKVIQTVVNTVYDFTDRYPNRMVQIEPAEPRRGTFYNAIFQRKWEEIKMNFRVYGYIGKAKEPYLPTKNYDKFVVLRKTTNFGNKN